MPQHHHMMPLLLAMALSLSAAAAAAQGAAPDRHPVARHSPVVWANGVYPTAVPTRGVPDGPIGGNGDLGVTLGGVVVPGSAIGSPGAGAQGLIPANNQNASLGALGMYVPPPPLLNRSRHFVVHVSRVSN